MQLQCELLRLHSGREELDNLIAREHLYLPAPDENFLQAAHNRLIGSKTFPLLRLSTSW